MSYDLFLYRFAGPASAFAKLMDEDDFEPPPMGGRGDVIAAISGVFPNTGWSDDGWGHFDGRGYRVAFHVGEESPVRSVMLNLYGDHAFLRDVATLCRDQGWQAHDPQTGKFLDLNDPSTEGVARFERFLQDVAGANAVARPGGATDASHGIEHGVRGAGETSPSSIAEFFAPRTRGEPSTEQRREVIALLDRLTNGTDAEIVAAYAPEAKIQVAVARETEAESELTVTSVDLNAYLKALPTALQQLRATGGPGFRFWIKDVVLAVVGDAMRVTCRVCSTFDPEGCFTEYRVGPSDGGWRVLEQRTHRQA